MNMATHLYFNGNILTMDSRGSCVKAMAVKDDIILGVGSEEELGVFIGPETKRIDLAGKTMLPGFYDGHSHFMRAGQNHLHINNSINNPTITTRQMIFFLNICLFRLN